MRILLLASVYPPHEMESCQIYQAEVARGLEARGHQCFVLTSRHTNWAPNGREGSERVRRSLFLTNHHGSNAHPSRLERLAMWQLGVERYDLAQFRHCLRETLPDVLLAWQIRTLPTSILLEAQARGLKTVYYVSDGELAQPPAWWRAHTGKPRSGARGLARGLSSQFVVRALLPYDYAAERPEPRYVVFSSRALLEDYRRRGLFTNGARVIYQGVPTPFEDERRVNHPDPRLPDLVFLGRVSYDKGVHNALEAMAILVNERDHRDLRLSIIGYPPDEEYDVRLKGLVARAGLDNNVFFLRGVPVERMAALLASFDVLVYPSIEHEHSDLTPIEAMARGLAVVGTTVGLGEEFYVDGENVLTFVAGDAAGLADRVEQLVWQSELLRRLGQAGQRLVEQRFTMTRFLDEIEDYLVRVVAEPEGTRV